MRIIKEAKVGDKVWLGETCYELLGQDVDHKRKPIPNQFVAKPVAWSDRILSLPASIKKFVQKTETIVIKFPVKVWD